MGIETNKKILQMSKHTVDSINRDKVKYEHENKSYKQTYISEIAGLLDVHKDKIKATFNRVTDSREDEVKSILDILYSAFKKNKMATYLPSFDIPAMAHATIRWNKTKQFEENDLDDIGHTYTALPYCDYFFTERSFYTLIMQSKYNDKYSCIVAWQKKEVLDIIKSI